MCLIVGALSVMLKPSRGTVASSIPIYATFISSSESVDVQCVCQSRTLRRRHLGQHQRLEH